VRAVPRLCESYPGIYLTTEEKAREKLTIAARTSQADTVKYKKNEQDATQKKNSNTE
jgi:hypothetical protein